MQLKQKLSQRELFIYIAFIVVIFTGLIVHLIIFEDVTSKLVKKENKFLGNEKKSRNNMKGRKEDDIYDLSLTLDVETSEFEELMMNDDPTATDFLIDRWVRIKGVVEYKNLGFLPHERYLRLYAENQITFFFDEKKIFDRIFLEENITLIGMYKGRSFLTGFTFEHAYIDHNSPKNESKKMKKEVESDSL